MRSKLLPEHSRPDMVHLTCPLDTLLDLVVKLQKMHVAWIPRVPYGRNANLRFCHVCRFQSRSIEHSLRRALRLRNCNVLARPVEVTGRLVLSDIVFAMSGIPCGRGEWPS